MISVLQARDIILENCRRQKAVTVSLSASVDRVLAEDIKADVAMPPFNRSMMDGYALRSEDTKAPHHKLKVIGNVAAGSYPRFKIGSGEAAKIMTGAPVPPGADAVQKIELTKSSEDGRMMHSVQPVQAGLHIVKRGEEKARGEIVLAAGSHITPTAVGVLAATGTTTVKIVRPPTVAILATGNELVAPDVKPLQGQIRDSNSFTLQALCRRLKLKTILLGIAKDDKALLKEKIRRGLACDMMLVTGGVSMGDHDFVDDVFKEMGFSIFFKKVAIKPGKPTVFARYTEKPIFGLPGNPVSSATVFDVLVRPALRKMMGSAVYSDLSVSGILSNAVSNKSMRELFHPAVTWYQDGVFRCHPLRTRGSGDISGYAKGNSYLNVPAETGTVPQGSTVSILLRDNFNLS